MRCRTTFAEALDEALRVASDDEPAVHESPRPWPAQAPPFLFVNAAPRFRPQAAARRLRMLDGVGEIGSRSRPMDLRPPGPPQPARTLTSTQQRALDELVGLGANLRVDFTLPELRRAFRSLARHYHPDRHPSSTPEESSRLSKQFARLNDQYRCLLAIVDR